MDTYEVTLVWEMSKTIVVRVPEYHGNYEAAGKIALTEASEYGFDLSDAKFVTSSMRAEDIVWIYG